MGEDDPGILKNWSDLLDDATALTPPPGAPPRPGETSFRERYQVVRLIGSGGMGSVYLVRDRLLNREAAMKVCSAPLMDPAVERQFMEEARVAARLEHPNILPVYDMGVDSHHRYFFVMRYVQGQSLAQGIATGTMPLARRIEVFAQICNAIRFAHSKGVLHRDIKPQNVLVGPFGETFVIDWGISKLVAPVPSTAEFAPGRLQTLSSGLVGTPAYMAPELLLPVGNAVDERVDVYALGVLLYNILGVTQPFRAETLAELAEVKMALRLNPAPSDAPAEYVAIARKAMAPSPPDRYEDVGRLVDDVIAAREHRPGRAWHDPAIVRVRKWARRHPTLVAVAATALLAFLTYHAYRYAGLMYESRFQTVYVTTTPPGVEIEIRRDGRVVASGTSPLLHRLEKGTYRLTFTHPGWRTFDADVLVKGGSDELRLDYSLIADMGRLAILPAEPDVTLEIVRDGERLQRAAGQAPFDLPTGTYRVTLSKTGSLEKRIRDVTVPYGRTAWIVADFSETHLWRSDPELLDGGTVACPPLLLDLDADGRLEALVAVVRSDTEGRSTRFAVLDVATGHRKGRLDLTIRDTIRDLGVGDDSDGRIVLLAFGGDGLYLFRPADNGPEASRPIAPSVARAVVTRGLLIAPTTGEVLVSDIRERKLWAIKPWQDSKPRLSAAVLTRADPPQVVVFWQDLGGALLAAAFDPSLPPGLQEPTWTRRWEGVLRSNVVPLDRGWAVMLGSRLVALDREGEPRTLAEVEGNGVSWTMCRVRSRAQDALFLFNAFTAQKLSVTPSSATVAWRKDYETPHPWASTHVVGGPVEADGDDETELVLLKPGEHRLRILDGKTGAPRLARATKSEFAIPSADLDGDGKGDLILSGPSDIEAWSPCGSGTREIVFNELPEEVHVHGASTVGDTALVLRPDSDGVRLVEWDVKEGKVAHERSVPGVFTGVALLPSSVIFQHGTRLSAYDRADLRPRWNDVRVEAERATFLEWGKIDAEDEIPDIVAAHPDGSGLKLEALSGADGRALWSRTLAMDPAYYSMEILDLNGDGFPDALFGDTSGHRDVVCGRHGRSCCVDPPADWRGAARQGTAIVWYDAGVLSRRGGDGVVRKRRIVEDDEPGFIAGVQPGPDISGDGVEELVLQVRRGRGSETWVLDGASLETIHRLSGEGHRTALIRGTPPRLLREVRGAVTAIESWPLDGPEPGAPAWRTSFPNPWLWWVLDPRSERAAVFSSEGKPAQTTTFHLLDLSSGKILLEKTIGIDPRDSRGTPSCRFDSDGARLSVEWYPKLYRLSLRPPDARRQPVWQGDGGVWWRE